MSHLQKIFFAAILLGAAMLGIAFVAGQRQVQQRSTPLFQESLSQLKELSHTKYKQSLRYLAYAHHAKRDSLHNAAALFHAMSHADAIHHANCRHAIEALGGTYSHPIIAPTQFTSTTIHLGQALLNKTSLHSSQMPEYINQALDDNNRYIARMLTWCDASDVKQIFLLQKILDNSTSSQLHIYYKVCPTCGDITWEAITTRHCPKCMTDSAKFIVIDH